MRSHRGVLVTGFEPFDGDTVNPSQDVACALDGAVVEGHRIVARVLPCAFESSLAALDAALAETKPALVVALGLAAGRAELSFERVAVNLVDARIADNAGAQPVDRLVIAGAPAARFTTLPVKAIVAALGEGGIPASLSLSAGSYVCNATFFVLMHRLARRRSTRGGFVHLPLLPEQVAQRVGQPSLPLAVQVEGIRLAIATAVHVRTDVVYAAGSLA